MQERDEAAAGSAAGVAIHRKVSGPLRVAESALDVRHLEREMM